MLGRGREFLDEWQELFESRASGSPAHPLFDLDVLDAPPAADAGTLQSTHLTSELWFVVMRRGFGLVAVRCIGVVPVPSIPAIASLPCFVLLDGLAAWRYEFEPRPFEVVTAATDGFQDLLAAFQQKVRLELGIVGIPLIEFGMQETDVCPDAVARGAVPRRDSQPVSGFVQATVQEKNPTKMVGVLRIGAIQTKRLPQQREGFGGSRIGMYGETETAFGQGLDPRHLVPWILLRDSQPVVQLAEPSWVG